MLPIRSSQAEDDCVARWASERDVDGLIEIITAAMDARRPRLAARLVNLLDDEAEEEEAEEPAILRARNAAKMWLHAGVDEQRHLFNAMEEAWNDAHRAHVKRIKRRMRARGAGDGSGRRKGRKGRRSR